MQIDIVESCIIALASLQVNWFNLLLVFIFLSFLSAILFFQRLIHLKSIRIKKYFIIPSIENNYGFAASSELQKRIEIKSLDGTIFESFFQNSPIGFLRIDLEGHILVSNNALLKILGIVSKEELFALNYIFNQHRDIGKAKPFITSINQRKDFEHCEKWRKKSGKNAYLKEYYRFVMDSSDDFRFIEIIVEDVTEKEKAERALQITEDKFKTIIDQVPVGIYRIISTGEIIFANQYLANLLGYSKPEDIKGLIAEQFISNPSGYKSFLEEQISEHKPNFIHEYVIKKKDGSSIWVQDTCNILYDTSDEVLFYDGIVEEISARKSAEQELSRLITAIDHISEGIIVTDQDGIIIYNNPAFEKMSLYSTEELKGSNIRILENGTQNKEISRKQWQTVLSGNTWTDVMIDKKKDGELFENYTFISPVKDFEGELIGLVFVKRDITEERKIEQQLRQSQKLQAIGTLAGGIAHDFNNILMGMQIYTEILLKKISTETNEHDLLQKVYSAQNRAKDLIRQILSFSRQSGDEREPLQISTIVKEALKLIKTTFPSTIKLVQKINDCGTILCNPTQIHQIVMNLCTNANHAMEGHGMLTVELDRIPHIEQPDGTITETSNSWIRIQVSDSGCGIEKKISERIFEPFFTTKGVGHGTGLGLATVHGIVKQYGGEIYFSSEIGKGTVFYIYLPAL
jgi:two-component system, cell cycle sensor histidine kinase and response regulator CckA